MAIKHNQRPRAATRLPPPIGGRIAIVVIACLAAGVSVAEAPTPPTRLESTAPSHLHALLWLYSPDLMLLQDDEVAKRPPAIATAISESNGFNASVQGEH